MTLTDIGEDGEHWNELLAAKAGWWRITDLSDDLLISEL